jgi:molybdopterin converting factor small subunit
VIAVRCLGHIATSVGAKNVELDGGDLTASEIVQKVGGMCAAGDPGFDVYNTLVLVEDGEASVPAASNAKVTDGRSVVLIPVSHGG